MSKESSLSRVLVFLVGVAFIVTAPRVEAQGLEPQIEVVMELMLDGDFEEAEQALRNFEDIAAGYSRPLGSDLLADFAYLDGVLAFYLDQDEAAAEDKWRWCLEANPDYQWRSDLVGGAGEQLFAQLSGDGVRSSRMPVIPLGYEISRSIWIDGIRATERSTVSVGWHMIQATCRNRNTKGMYTWISPDEILPCPCGYGGCFEEIPEEATEQDQFVLEVGIGGFFDSPDLYTRQNLGGSFHTASKMVFGLNIGTLWLDPAILDVAIDLETRFGTYMDVGRLRLAGGAIVNTQLDMDGADYVGADILLGLFGEARSAPYDDASLGLRVGVYPIELINSPIFGELVTALTFFANYDI